MTGASTSHASESEGSIDDHDNCPECSGEVAADGEETWCVDCGLVVDEYRIDHGPGPYKPGGPFPKQERTGAPLTPTRHDYGLSTEIGHRQDGKGNLLGGRQRRRLGRLRRQHGRAHFRSKAERNLAHAFTEIDRLRAALDLPRSVHSRACVLYRLAQGEDLVTGRSIESLAAGCLYAACREQGLLRTIDEIVENSGCNMSAVRNAYGVVRAELGIAARPRRAGDFIPRLASAANVSAEARERAVELAETATSEAIDNGRNPAGVAAACLYLATREYGPSTSQQELSRLAGVTDATIRARYRELMEITG